jgi:hypothetical protein
MIRLALLLGLLCSQSAFATYKSPLVCRLAFKADVIACAKVVRTISRPSLRLSALRSCLQEAVVELKGCSSSGGTNQCLTTCQSNLDESVATCYSTFDPAQCNGNVDCEISQLNQRTTCLQNADVTYNSCVQNCN